METDTTPLRFDLNKYYSLHQIFDRVGRFQFPNEWSGLEVAATPYEDHVQFAQQRRDILKKRAVADKEFDELLDIDTFGSSEKRSRKIYEKQIALKARVKKLTLELAQLPDNIDYYISCHDAFERRNVVEEILCSAFQAKKIILILGEGLIVNWDQWTGNNDFKISFLYSIVFTPRRISRKRRNPAYVNRAEFDEWARPFEAGSFSQENATLDEQISGWFKAYVRKSDKKPLKDDLRNECCQRFPKCSKRQFDRIWGNEVPDSWKRPGPLD